MATVIPSEWLRRPCNFAEAGNNMTPEQWAAWLLEHLKGPWTWPGEQAQPDAFTLSGRGKLIHIAPNHQGITITAGTSAARADRQRLSVQLLRGDKPVVSVTPPHDRDEIHLSLRHLEQARESSAGYFVLTLY